MELNLFTREAFNVYKNRLFLKFHFLTSPESMPNTATITPVNNKNIVDLKKVFFAFGSLMYLFVDHFIALS